MTSLEQYQHLLEGQGVSLQELGIRDIALKRGDALSATELLKNTSLPILGGDVYVKRDGRIELAYANWHSDPQPDEAAGDYLSRSWTTTKNYIESYPEPADGEPLFALVLGG